MIIAIVLTVLTLVKAETYNLKSQNRPLGLFIQVSSSNTWVLPRIAGWLDKVCANNRRQPEHQRINDIILQDLALEVTNINNTKSYTMLWNVLDLIVPYLPGGSKQCFGNVFVGHLGLTWPYPGNYTIDPVEDPKFRQEYVRIARETSKEFMKKYPKTRPIHWYITNEANLNYLINEKFMRSYLVMFTNTIIELNKLSHGRVAWSPTFWSTWSDVTDKDRQTLKRNLETLFNECARQSPPGINWLVLQDGLGKATNVNCTGIKTRPLDAVKWLEFLRNLNFKFVSLQMNEELFLFDKNCGIGAGNFSEQILRENYYKKMGVPIGASFELRYWREI